MDRYVGKCGNVVGQADDELTIIAESAEAAMQQLLGYSVDGWPESDGEYDAVCWVELDGNVLIVEDVTIMPDGTRDLP